MGSKRALIEKGLGEMLLREARNADRVVDLFCGSGAVASYVAEATPIPVLAVDLQQYAVDLAASVVARTEPLADDDVRRRWLSKAERARDADSRWIADRATGRQPLSARAVKQARRTAEDGPVGSIVRAYGGHYFSIEQAVTLDHMLATAPKRGPLATVASAVLIRTGSRCAAAPGHTAQPFQPTKAAIPYISAAWKKDPIVEASAIIEELAPRHALVEGAATRADALTVAASLDGGDLVVVDPPYSAVQYSRFYHVLEALARRTIKDVSGVGRYGSITERPRSDFSLKTRAQGACTELLNTLAATGATVVFTFPAGVCSNGLSGTEILAIARRLFRVDAVAVNGRFSTLGGNGNGRPSRHPSEELILTMTPRRSRKLASRSKARPSIR